MRRLELIAVVALALGCEASVEVTRRTGENNPRADSPSISPTKAERASKKRVTEWTTFSAPESGFRAQFPGKPKVEPVGEAGIDDATAVSYSVVGPRRLFASALVTTVPEERLAKLDVDALVSQGLEALAKGADPGTEETSEVEMLGKTVRRTVFAAVREGRRIRVEARAFFVAPRLYQLQTTSVPGYSDSIGAEFFESFTLIDDDAKTE